MTLIRALLLLFLLRAVAHATCSMDLTQPNSHCSNNAAILCDETCQGTNPCAPCGGANFCVHNLTISQIIRANQAATCNDINALQTGKVTGPGTSTDRALSRWNGTSGATLLNAPWTLSDQGAMTGATSSGNSLTVTNAGSGILFSGINNGTGPLLTLGSAGVPYGFEIFNDRSLLSDATSSGVAYQFRQSGSGDIFAAQHSSTGTQFLITHTGTIDMTATSGLQAVKIIQNGAGPVARLWGPTSLGLDIANDGHSSIISSSNSPALLVTQNGTSDTAIFGPVDLKPLNHFFDGYGNGVEILSGSQVIPADPNGNDWHTTLQMDTLTYDVRNIPVGGPYPTSIRSIGNTLTVDDSTQVRNDNLDVNVIPLDQVLRIGANLRQGPTSKIWSSAISEVQFTGSAFSTATSGLPLMSYYGHLLGNGSFALNGAPAAGVRTSGIAMYVYNGVMGNDLNSNGAIPLIESGGADTLVGYLVGPVAAVSGSLAEQNVKPLLIKTAMGGNKPQGRSYHDANFTFGDSAIGPWAGNGNGAGAVIQSAGGGPQTDANFNFTKAPTTETVSVKAVHIEDDRLTVTSGVSKTALQVDATGTWTSTLPVTAVKATATGAGAGSGFDNRAIDAIGAIIQEDAASGALNRLVINPQPLTCSSGATCTAIGLGQPGIIFGVTAKITTTITGCTTVSIGDGTTANRWANAISPLANTQTNVANFTSTAAPALIQAAYDVIVTCNGGTFSGGVIDLALTELRLSPPTQ